MSAVYKNGREMVEIDVMLMGSLQNISCQQSGRKVELNSLSAATTAQSFSRQSGAEVRGLSFVCSASEVCWLYSLWNIQNLGAVPPYEHIGVFHELLPNSASQITVKQGGAVLRGHGLGHSNFHGSHSCEVCVNETRSQ